MPTELLTHKRIVQHLIAAALLVSVLPIISSAGLAPYDFELIAEQATAAPAINDAGQIVYYSGPSSGQSHAYLYDGGLSTLVAHNPVVGAVGYPAVLNNAPVVAANFSNSVGVVGWDPVAGEHQLFPPLFLYHVFDINNPGTMLVVHSDIQGNLIVSVGGSPVTQTTLLTYPPGTKTLPQAAAINDSGAVAVYERDNDLKSFSVRLLVNGVQTFAVSQADGYTALGNPELTNSGALLFAYQKPNLQEGILQYKDGILTEVVGPSKGQGPVVAYDVAANDAGTIVYRRLDLSGIFVGTDELASHIIAQGDPLFGSSVQAIEMSENALNASGQIAFLASLNDNRSVIVLATPTPEPGTVSLVLVALPALVRRTRRGR